MTEEEQKEAQAIEESVAARLDKMEEAKTEAEAQVDAEMQPPERQKILDRNGRQLRFEGFEITEIATRFKGTVEIDVGQLKPYEEVRLEVTAKVIEIRNKDEQNTLRRIQILRPIAVEIIEAPGDTPE